MTLESSTADPAPDPAARSRRYFVVPHTHWDREWYRPFEYFRLALAHVVDGVLDVLEQDQRFTSFTLDGQAIVLEDYLEVRPENEDRLRRLLAAGRIEVGPSYVLPDEFLVGAEPLVRNLLIGRAVCERFGAEPSPVGYLPDSFGHPLQLPQLLAGFGIGSFIFSRGLGDELDTLGVVFRWRGPEGSEVLAFQQLPHYGNFAAIADVDDAEARVRAIVGEFGSALERARVNDVLLCNGTDHLPVEPRLPELCLELERRLPGSSFTIARYSDYVRAVDGVEVPAWSGELLGSRLQNILRGVNSARLYVKQANARAEQRLLGAETLAALRHLHDLTPFPRADFTLAWRELLRCQPHDTICGCSCDEVHRDALARYESLERTLAVLESRALEGLDGSGEEAVGVVNLLPYRRRGLIELPGAEPALVDLDGFAARSVSLEPRAAGPGDASSAIENDCFRVEAAPGGGLTLADKRTGKRFEHLHVLEDESDMGDLYNFCPVAGAETWRSGDADIRVLATGPLVWELEVRVRAERPVGLDGDFRPLPEIAPITIVTVVRLVRDSRRIEFTTTLENACRDHRLRAIFPLAGRSEVVRAQSAFALVRRPASAPRPQTDWVEPPDGTQHTLGVVAVGALGLLTQGLPEYEVRSGADGDELCLTLLRCTGLISQPSGVLATRPQSAGPQTRTPEGQCLGRHELRYALILDADELDDVGLLREEQDYRYGFMTVAGGLSFDPPLTMTGDVVFSCLKGAEDGDGLILRCFNPADSDARVGVSGAFAVSRTRLDETSEETAPPDGVVVAANQIATLRLRR